MRGTVNSGDGSPTSRRRFESPREIERRGGSGTIGAAGSGLVASGSMNPRSAIRLAALAALLAKLACAALTSGTNDADTFYNFGRFI